jgi:hypothetical protein
LLGGNSEPPAWLIRQVSDKVRRASRKGPLPVRESASWEPASLRRFAGGSPPYRRSLLAA